LVSSGSGGGGIVRQAGIFVRYTDPRGNVITSVNKDGTVSVYGINFADGSSQTSAATTQTVPTNFAKVFNVVDYGAKVDGQTDDTAAVVAAIQAAYNAGGGTVQFPTGTCLIAGQINIPNDGGTTFDNSPLQPSIRITGSATSGALIPGGGGPVVPFGSGPAYGGSVLNLTYNSPTAKISTFGFGPLEIDHLTMVDTGLDSATFFFSSNTTCHIHDVTFLGTKVGASSVNDAIWLGNNNATPSGSFNAPFQGYGTIITHCYFEGVKRALFGQAFCNSVMFSENTIWSSGGNSTGGAIELGALSGNADANNIIHNLIETTFYKYGVRVIQGLNNKIIGNDCWDGGAGTFQAAVRLEQNTASNFVIGGTTLGAGQQPYLSDGGNENTASNGNTTYFSVTPAFQPSLIGSALGVQLNATSSLTAGQVVKIDPNNPNAVIVATTSDTGAGIPIGIVANSPSAGQMAQVIYFGKVHANSLFAPLLGTGTASLGQFVIVDTTTNGRVQCTSSYTAGTVIGTVINAQASVGSPVGVLLGLR